MWYVHTMDYYSVIKQIKVLVLATTWMNLENTLNEGSHSRRPHIV